jgi:hypothetical protein
MPTTNARLAADAEGAPTVTQSASNNARTPNRSAIKLPTLHDIEMIRIDHNNVVCVQQTRPVLPAVR